MAMTRSSTSNPPPPSTTNPPPPAALNPDIRSQQLASIVSCLENVVDVLTRLLVYYSSQQFVILPSSISPNPQFMVENPSSQSEPRISITHTTTSITPATLIKIANPSKNNKPQQNQNPQQTSLYYPKNPISIYNQHNYNPQLLRGPSNTPIRPWGVQKQLEYGKGQDICYVERFGFGLTCMSSIFSLLMFTEEPGELPFVLKEFEPKTSYVGAVTFSWVKNASYFALRRQS